MAMKPIFLDDCLVRDSYSINPQSAVLRTEMEAGPIRQRRICTDIPVQVSVVWKFNSIQFRVFEAWYKLKLYDGAEWFRMKIMNGSGMNETDCRFTEPYAASLDGYGLYSVSATLECRGMEMMSDSDIGEYLG